MRFFIHPPKVCTFKNYFLRIFLFASLVSSQALADEIENRTKLAGEVSKIASTACRMESRNDRKLIELASILIMHGETKDARSKIADLKAEAKTKLCKDALKKLDF